MEAILGDRRNVTFFSGYNHKYSKVVRYGRNLYTLVTTDGASWLIGSADGLVDHVAWVTMTEYGPIVVKRRSSISHMVRIGIPASDVHTDLLWEDLESLSIM